MRIREATEADAAAVAAIYNHYIEHTVVTFEETPVSAREMAARIEAVSTGGHPWLVAERDGEVCGYAYAMAWRSRSAYRHSVETTVYVDDRAVRSGLGRGLYQVLLPELRAAGFHTAMGVIALPNEGSIALHERFGFRKVGELAAVGRKFDRWVDVGYWQLML